MLHYLGLGHAQLSDFIAQQGDCDSRPEAETAAGSVAWKPWNGT